MASDATKAQGPAAVPCVAHLRSCPRIPPADWSVTGCPLPPHPPAPPRPPRCCSGTTSSPTVASASEKQASHEWKRVTFLDEIMRQIPRVLCLKMVVSYERMDYFWPQ